MRKFDSLIVVLVLVVVISFVQGSGWVDLFSSLTLSKSWNGYEWDFSSEYGEDGGASVVIDDQNFLVLKSFSNPRRLNNGQVVSESMVVNKKDFSGVDELLLVFDTKLFSSVGWDGTASVWFTFGFLDDDGEKVLLEEGKDISGDGVGVIPDFVLADDLRVYKLVNNFDGSWTLFKGTNVGDVFIKEGVVSVDGGIRLFFKVVTRAESRGVKGVSTGEVRLLNIVEKEDEVPVCDVDEVILGDGSCLKLSTIIKANEAAVKESDDELLDRVVERLLVKENYLSKKINLSDDAVEVGRLRGELDDLRSRLSDVESRDPYVVELLRNGESSLVGGGFSTPLKFFFGGLFLLLFLLVRK